MICNIFAVGKPKLSYVVTGLEEYLKRFPHSFRVNIHYLKSGTQESEANLLLQSSAKMKRIAMDERGKNPSSREFATLLNKWYEQQPIPMAFLIGGADGLHSQVREEASYTLSLSSFTFPHEMALLLLTEQLYRAHSILTKHPYHRD